MQGIQHEAHAHPKTMRERIYMKPFIVFSCHALPCCIVFYFSSVSLSPTLTTFPSCTAFSHYSPYLSSPLSLSIFQYWSRPSFPFLFSHTSLPFIFYLSSLLSRAAFWFTFFCSSFFFFSFTVFFSSLLIFTSTTVPYFSSLTVTSHLFFFSCLYFTLFLYCIQP